jgi:hypothetical protein
MCRDRRRRSEPEEPSVLDDMLSSLRDATSEITRSITGLPFRVVPGEHLHPNYNNLKPIYAEPVILSPDAFIFQIHKSELKPLDSPVRLVTRPLTIADFVNQFENRSEFERGVWRPPRNERFIMVSNDDFPFDWRGHLFSTMKGT